MRTLTLTCATALALSAAACGGGDSDNVMASSANELSPAQVDLALGPEIANTGGNGLESANDMNAIDPVENDTPAEPVATDNNSSEQ